MINKNKKPIVFVGIGLVLIVLFLMIPRKPWSSKEEPAANAMSADQSKLQQAIELVNGSNPMQGIMMLREIVAKDSNNVEAQYWLGVFAVQSGQFEKAIPRFEKVISLDPQYLSAYMDLGAVYKEMGQMDVALGLFEQAADIDSTNNYALFFSGQAAELTGNKLKAKKYYQQLLRHTADTAIVEKVKELIKKNS
jgi:tetratricopeptide (TPR) repeat protein